MPRNAAPYCAAAGATAAAEPVPERTARARAIGSPTTMHHALWRRSAQAERLGRGAGDAACGAGAAACGAGEPRPISSAPVSEADPLSPPPSPAPSPVLSVAPPPLVWPVSGSALHSGQRRRCPTWAVKSLGQCRAPTRGPMAVRSGARLRGAGVRAGRRHTTCRCTWCGRRGRSAAGGCSRLCSPEGGQEDACCTVAPDARCAARASSMHSEHSSGRSPPSHARTGSSLERAFCRLSSSLYRRAYITYE
jgi:hypothetical protein